MSYPNSSKEWSSVIDRDSEPQGIPVLFKIPPVAVDTKLTPDPQPPVVWRLEKSYLHRDEEKPQQYNPHVAANYKFLRRSEMWMFDYEAANVDRVEPDDNKPAVISNIKGDGISIYDPPTYVPYKHKTCVTMFFEMYGFNYDLQAPLRWELNRFFKAKGWRTSRRDNLSWEQMDALEKEDKKTKDGLRKAVNADFSIAVGEDFDWRMGVGRKDKFGRPLEWVNLYRILGVPNSYIPHTAQECKNVLAGCWVPVYDMMECIDNKGSLPVFASFPEFEQYCRNTGKLFPRDLARSALMRWLLRSEPYHC